MRTYRGYEKVSVGDIPQKKLEKAIKTGKLTLSASDLKGNRVMLLHPANAKIVRAAKAKGKGVSGLQFAGPEITNDIEWHDSMGGSMHGGSLWSWLKTAAPKVGKFFKENWDVIQPIVSRVADAAIPAAAAYFGQPQLGVMGRAALKEITGVGVGIKDKRIAALVKARKAKAEKKGRVVSVMDGSTGGSFLIN
jgi:hypothetical protein